MPSDRQMKGLALEQATYRTLIRVLQQRMQTDGEEGHTDYGMVWVGHDTIFLFWNSQVPKCGSYTEDDAGGKRISWRRPDLVLCHRIWNKSEFRDSYDWTLLPIMAVELKNMNLGYLWNTAWSFDRDVMRRFLMVPMAYIAKLLSSVNWEENPRNSFPNAIKILIQPAFGFTPRAQRVPLSRKRLTVEEARALDEKRRAGLIPYSGSSFYRSIFLSIVNS